MVPNRQKIAVSCIEDEQQPVEKEQGRVPDFMFRRFGRFPGDCCSKAREHTVEDQLRKTAGHALLFELSLLDDALVKCSPFRVGKKGIPPEGEEERLEPVTLQLVIHRILTVLVENRSEIDLEELFGDRSRPCNIEAPLTTIGQDAPAQLSSCHIIGASDVAQHLA